MNALDELIEEYNQRSYVDLMRLAIVLRDELRNKPVAPPVAEQDAAEKWMRGKMIVYTKDGQVDNECLFRHLNAFAAEQTKGKADHVKRLLPYYQAIQKRNYRMTEACRFLPVPETADIAVQEIIDQETKPLHEQIDQLRQQLAEAQKPVAPQGHRSKRICECRTSITEGAILPRRLPARPLPNPEDAERGEGESTGRCKISR